MSAGLWISNSACRQYHTISEAKLDFLQTLDDNRIGLTTINGFPFGNFHSSEVKAGVYQPDWSESSRYQYTLDLAKLLADCMPADQSWGSISTLPLGFRPLWNDQKHHKALQALCLLALELDKLQHNTGKKIVVCLEMEPGCVLEKTDEIVHFFNTEIADHAKRLRIPFEVIQQHIGICFDVCHQAVMFENISASLKSINDANIFIGKVQLSSALHIDKPHTPENRELLHQYAEPKYLHQVCTFDEENNLVSHTDLAEALVDEKFPFTHPWRIHFHLPIQASKLKYGAFSTTQNNLLEMFDILKSLELKPHMEVETYTWQVLPDTIRPENDSELSESITEELMWVENQLNNRQLLISQ